MRLTILLIFTAISLASGQDDLAFLNKFDTTGFTKEFRDGLRTKLSEGLKAKQLIQYLVIPSFEPEYILSLEKDSLGFNLVYNALEKNYWYLKDKKEVKLRSIRKTINPEYASSLRRLFDAAIKYRNHDDRLGHDGTNYFFSVFSGSQVILTGKIWSPAKGTRTKSLTEICEKYILILREKLDFPPKLLADTEALIRAYK
jgi:hypothetical protein